MYDLILRNDRSRLAWFALADMVEDVTEFLSEFLFGRNY